MHPEPLQPRANSLHTPDGRRFRSHHPRLKLHPIVEGGENMKMRKLGNSGLEVSPLAFGGNVFGWTVDEPASFQLLNAFVAAGFNFIDTADMYSNWVPGNQGGESE